MAADAHRVSPPYPTRRATVAPPRALAHAAPAPGASLARRVAPLLLLASACTPDPPGDQPKDSAADSPTDSPADSPADTDTGDDPDPLPPGTWLRDERDAPGSVSFTELAWHPPDDERLEWIELHNPMVVNMDLSGWSLADGVQYSFAEGTILPAGGYLVIAADPSLLAESTGLADALGPYTGNLDNGGERVELRSNGGRLIDTIEFGDDDPWPVAPDGSGATLAKLDPDAVSDHAEHWTSSAELGGTPGRANGVDPSAPPTTLTLIPDDATWSYDASGDYPAIDWAEPEYDDSSWATGAAIFYAGGPEGEVAATLRITADNYYGIYLGEADGTNLRQIGQDPDGDWTTVESYSVDVGPLDRLYLAAWEAPSDYGGPQMVIAEAELPDTIVGTSASAFEWVLGPTNGCPGTSPPDPAPSVDSLLADLADAAWAAPAADADRSSSTWGWAVSGSFDAGTRYVWPDTFNDTSVTNTENTYALLRSVDTLQGTGGTTEIAGPPTTTTFRTPFDFDEDPTHATLSVTCTLDDGAVVYLNGVEVGRENLPSGAVDAGTYASTPVSDAAEVYLELDTDSLVRGTNVLAVEVHQAEPDDPDLRFGCSLTARISASSNSPAVLLSELAASTASPFWAELQATTTVNTDGMVLRSSAGDEVILSTGTLSAGGYAVVDDLGFQPASGDVLYLYDADRSVLLDAVRVSDSARARDGDTWWVPDAPTPGAANSIAVATDVVINELMYHRAPVSAEDTPYAERTEEWIELYNRGDVEIDLGGWQLVDAVAFVFPAGTTLPAGGYLVVANDAASLREAYPEIDILGDYSGALANSGDRVLLRDALGNPADEVRYADSGRWPEPADGGGSSLELRDPWADNTAPEAWAASDESARAGWVSYSYRGTAEPSKVGPDGTWQEFVLGLLDAGEVLIDDLSVVQDPDTDPVEVIQNGGFDDDAHWRIIGNHRHSMIIADPDDAGNRVLDLVATGPTEHMHNHAETTLREAIGTREYAISFRARWVSGSNQLNTRLYFNRLPRTFRVEMPTESGTPGAPNSTQVDNLGPTFDGLHQDVAVPPPGTPVEIGVDVADPDGVDAVTLQWAVDGTAFSALGMSEDTPGHWTASIPGQAAATIVQFYVEARDARGATSIFPVAGPDSRALLTFDDGNAATTGLHTLRLLMTEADSDWLLDPPNLMSNDLVGATVVYDEAKVHYDVGTRAKGSERGRPEQPRLGYAVRFDEPFRGGHRSVLIDRSEGVNFGQREFLLNLVAQRVGLVSAEYNDLVHVVTPRAEHTGSAELQLDRFSDLVLAAQYEDGDAGPQYDYELIYYPLSTDDGTAEGQKLPAPDSVIGTAITDLGADKESWRWNFELQNNLGVDDYGPLMGLGQTFAASDAAWEADLDTVIDVDQWLRAFAFATLAGAVDNYGGDGSQHNARLYTRPADGRMLLFPHDLDYFGSEYAAVVGNGDLSRMIEDPVRHRLYYQHLLDLLDRAYGTAYLQPWCDQLATLLPAQSFSYNCAFIDARAAWVRDGAGDAVLDSYPALAFAITTNGGADFDTSASAATLTGEGWIDVRTIELDGVVLDVEWLDDQTWQVDVPLVDGDNVLTLVALDLGGQEVGQDMITVTRTP